jgi:predicted transcriptional regulator
MNPPSEPRPRQRRYSARLHARLDSDTHAKLEALATALHRKRAAILRYVMQWALAHTNEWTIDPSIPASPHLVHMLVDPELLQQVQDAADAHGVTVAAWLRHAMRQVTPDDFPASWRAGETAVRSHESGYYDRKFQVRLNEATSRKLETLTTTFHRSAAEVIRQLVAQAHPEDFPNRWHKRAAERRAPQVQGENRGRGREPQRSCRAFV